jgi:hypothetical protein
MWQEASNSLNSKNFTVIGIPGPRCAESEAMSHPLSTRARAILRAVIGAAIVLSFHSTAALAQGRPVPVKGVIVPSKTTFPIPPGFAPPSGMCRIWIDSVPAEKQPAPTDCASAVKNRPLNGRVIFGDDKPTKSKSSKKKSDEEPSL